MSLRHRRQRHDTRSLRAPLTDARGRKTSSKSSAPPAAAAASETVTMRERENATSTFPCTTAVGRSCRSGRSYPRLTPSKSKPTLRMDINDPIYYNQPNRSSNVPLKRLLAFIMTSPLCSPVRLHWGKAGWPDPGCWNGAEFYKDTWCDFGCAIMELDPYGKFKGGDPDVWNWEGANLERCCTPDGYDTSLVGCGCDVIPVRTPDECPEAPFFTNR